MKNSALDRDELGAMAREAGDIALGYFRRAKGERKQDRTLVTEADRRVEEFLRQRSEALLPGVPFIGEETGGSVDERADVCVVVDPIDGTSAFVAGIPTWCVCVGVLAGGKSIAGAVYLPAAGELYLAIEGLAWWNSEPLAGQVANPGGDPFVVAYAGFHKRHGIPFAGKVRSLGSTAYHICLVARGAARGALLGKARLWDLVAAAAMLEAVGGTLVYLSGRPLDWKELLNGQPASDYLVAAQREDIPKLLPVFRQPSSHSTGAGEGGE